MHWFKSVIKATVLVILHSVKGDFTSCSVNRRPATVTEVWVSSRCSHHGTSTTPIYAASSSPVPFSTSNYMSVIEKWRAALGLIPLTYDSALEANALKTCTDGNGRMVHNLNPGSLAQVLATGNMHVEFERILVGGWLCEKRDVKVLHDVCPAFSIGWAYTSTRHAEILTSMIHTKIGCATFGGVTGCDLA